MNTIKELQKSLTDVKRDILTLPSNKLCLPEDLFDERVIDKSRNDLNILLPLVVYQNNQKYIIVDGCKRYVTTQKTSVGFICVVLKLDEIEKTIDRKKYSGLLRILLNSSRKIGLLEKVLFVKWLKANTDDKLYKEFCSFLEIDDRERHELERLSECDFSIQSAVNDKILDSSVAFEVNRMDVNDKDAIISFFESYSFSKQMQRELVDILSELAFRERCSIKDLLALEPIKEIERNNKLNNPQKIEKIRNFLFELRFPLVTKAKKLWKEKTSSINPDPSRIHFKPSESFEKDFLEIRVSVSSAKQAKEIFTKLSNISEDEWGEIIYPSC
ncbi:MAG: hypothetical protein N2053_04785 [Chitinispirillaceae bacterium]|nr:hypothetical protein [Chitinispirillaceae bacterium]